MSIRPATFVAYLLALTPSLLLVTACGAFGEEEVTPYQAAKQEFDEAIAVAVEDEMVPSVPAEYVVLGFTRTDDGIYTTSYLDPSGGADDLELATVANVCIGPDSEILEVECGSRTESGSYELQDVNGTYVLVFPEGALDDRVRLSGNRTSLERAFDRGWDLWAPES